MDGQENKESLTKSDDGKTEIKKKKWIARITWNGWDRFWNTVNSTATLGVFFFVIIQNNLVTESADASKESAKAAVDAVETAQKQFEIENTPYLIIEKFDAIDFKLNELFVLKFKVKNLGKGVIAIDSLRWVYEPGQKSEEHTLQIIERKFPTAKWLKGHTYVSNEFPGQMTTQGDKPITQESINLIKEGVYMFWAAEFRYTNLMNKKKRRLKIILRLNGADLKNEAAIIKIDNSSVD